MINQKPFAEQNLICNPKKIGEDWMMQLSRSKDLCNRQLSYQLLSSFVSMFNPVKKFETSMLHAKCTTSSLWQRTEFVFLCNIKRAKKTQTKLRHFGRKKYLHISSDTWVPRRSLCQIFIKKTSLLCKSKRGKMLLLR